MNTQRKDCKTLTNGRNGPRGGGGVSSYSSTLRGLPTPLNNPNRSETPIKYGVEEVL